MISRAAAPLLGLALAFALGGCGDSSSAPATTGGTGSGSTAATAATATDDGATTGVTHAAPDLEAVLPDELGDVELTKGSTTGADVFGANAFSRSMSRFLAREGKKPKDLEFANARDASQEGTIEVGAFRVQGVEPTALREAIVAASRPNAPGLEASPETVAGKEVTRMVYPGGSRVFLYEGDAVVFYVGTTDDALAVSALEALP